MAMKNRNYIRALAMSTLIATCSTACTVGEVDSTKEISKEQDVFSNDSEAEEKINQEESDFRNDPSTWIHSIDPKQTDFTQWKDKDYEVGEHNLFMKIDEDADYCYYDNQLIEVEVPEGYTVEYYFPMEADLRRGRSYYTNVKFTNTEPVTVRGYYDTEKERYIYATFGTPKEPVKIKTYSENKN